MLTNDEVVYLDSSALVKLVIREVESEALSVYLASHLNRASCSLAIVEVIRAVRPHGLVSIEHARLLIDRILVIQIDSSLLHAAARLDPITLRSLDATHLAAAARLGPALGAVVTYDARMIDAARALGLAVDSPRP